MQLPLSDPKSLWGPVLWKTIHVLALFNSSPGLKVFFKNLKDLVPCPKCSQHIHELMKGPMNFEKQMDIAFEQSRLTQSSEPVFVWTVKFHNAVNKDINKKFDWTPEEVFRNLTKTNNNIFLIFLSVTLFIFIISLIFFIS